MFPKELKKFQECILVSKEAVESTIKERGEFVKKAKKVILRNRRISKILTGLLFSWKETDPGKSCDVFFFLDCKQEKRVVVREFLSVDDICKSQEEWREYEKNKSYYGKYDKVPIWYPVVSLTTIARDKCKKCGSMEPVVEHYVQTLDSPDGDNWLKEKIVFCVKCHKTTRLSRENSSNRF
ncbi:MAG: hypothetical protein WCO84_02135 [bacterium]